MALQVLIPIAFGTEEIEAITIADTLVRAGASVTIASCEDTKTIKMSRNVTVVADELIQNCKDREYDLIAVPGGTVGATRCGENKVLIELLKRQKSQNKWYGAICAAPALVLQPHNLLDGPAVSYPLLLDKIKDKGEGRVVVSNKCVTSIGPGSSLEFALKLVEVLYGSETMQHHFQAMCAHPMTHTETTK